MYFDRKRLLRWSRLLSVFFFGQGLVQCVRLLSGFLLIRWLSKDDYADFTLISSILITTSMMVELGFTQCLTGLIGRNVGKPEIVGRYLAACLYYRQRIYALGVVVLFFVFYSIAPKFDWGFGLWFSYWLMLSGSLYFSLINAIHSPVLLLEQRLKESYILSLSGGGTRLVLIGLASVLSVLSTPIVVAFNLLDEAISGIGKYRLTRSRISMPEQGVDITPERKEVWRQSVPRVPSLLFTAFSGQLVVFLMGIYGSKDGVAEIGALTRIGMLFVILRYAGGVLVGPYFARSEPATVLLKVVYFYALNVAMIVVGSACAYFFPMPLLWLLGDGYMHLGYEVFLVVLAALIRISSMLMFSLCNARKYTFPWYSLPDVLPQLLIIFYWLCFMDLSSLVHLLYFAVAMSVSKLFSKTFILVFGLKGELRVAQS